MRREIARIVLAACLISIPAFISQATTAAEAIACGDSRIPIRKFSVTVAELAFAGQPHFKIANLQQIVSDLKQQTYEGPTDGTLSELEEKARRAWQDEGFFQVQVQSEATVLTSNPVSERVAVTLHVDEGKQYRLSKITFKNNRALTNYTALRKLFPIKGGEIFKRSVIAEGLENLRRVYGEYGYANFTSFPGTMTHEKAGTISLTVDFDEGKQFVVSDMHVLGTSDEAGGSILRDAPLQPGQVYNQRLAEMTVEHLISLPSGFSPASRIHFKLDEENGTLMTFKSADRLSRVPGLF